MPPLLQLQIDSQNYRAGDVVKAKAILNVKKPKDVANSQLTMNFLGAERTVVKYHTDKNTNKRSASDIHEFFSESTILTTIGPEGLPKGTYEFPCDLKLGDDYPSSFRVYHHGSSAAIRYRVGLLFRFDGYWKQDDILEKEFFVHALPRVPPPHLLEEQMFEAKHQLVKLCCCYKRGSMTMASALSKQGLTRNDTLTSSFVVLNTSIIPVLKVQVSLLERYELNAERKDYEITNVLARQTFQPEDVSGLQKLEKMDENIKVEDIQKGLYNKLNSPRDSEKVVVTFNIRPNVKESFYGNLVKRIHEVETIVFTPDGYTDPEFVTVVEIFPSDDAFIENDPTTSFRGRPEAYVTKAIEVAIVEEQPMTSIKEEATKSTYVAATQPADVTIAIESEDNKSEKEFEAPVQDVTGQVDSQVVPPQQEIEAAAPDITDQVPYLENIPQQEVEELALHVTEQVTFQVNLRQQEVDQM